MFSFKSDFKICEKKINPLIKNIITIIPNNPCAGENPQSE